MKKSELKTLIKPLVKECIHEVLLEEGLLSNVVAEFAKGMQAALLVENKSPANVAKKSQDSRVKLAEHRKKMLDAVGRDAYNGTDLFEGTTPIATNQPQAGAPDLGDPRDSGVDISSLIGHGAQIWQNMK